MRPDTWVMLGVAVWGLASAGAAQSVTIQGVRPSAVVQRLQARLPERFVLRASDDKSALFVLDQGMMAQRNGPLRGMMVPVVIELRVRFKDKKDGLLVTAAQEIVGGAGQAMEFRQPVQSPGERAKLQTLLDAVREDLTTPAAPPDSGSGA